MKLLFQYSEETLPLFARLQRFNNL